MPATKAEKILAAVKAKNLIPLETPDSFPTPAHPHTIAVNVHGFYSIPKSYMGRELPDVLKSGAVYEPETLAFMQNIVGAGDIVSGGGFIGDFFPALSRALAPDAVLHSFEPNPVSYAAALHTIALNSLSNISISAVGVGAQSDVMHLQIARAGDNQMAAGARIVKDPDDLETIEVTIVRLDDLIPEHRQVSIVHLDVEGHEKPALEGAQELIRRCKPVIILEARKEWKQRDYEKFLRELMPDLNYTLTGGIERNCVLIAQP